MNGNSINAKIIELYIKENNLSIAEFCKLCKISPSTYKRIKDNKDFRLNALFKIAKIMNLKPYQFFE